VWSLGITLLELAETNPPLHEVHPMKALMMIPMRDPPAFSQPEKWSREFKDFVAQCLIKQPEKRKTATEIQQVIFNPNFVNSDFKLASFHREL
jgi:serine/threonine protein kinase